MALRFYNTLTQQVEPFAPLQDNTVRMYTCGPTVYNYAHIGNFRTFTFEDILRRWLRARGYQLDHVMNITDVEDKIIRNAAAENKSLAEYTEPYTQAFLEDSAALRLERPERVVKATEHIQEMVAAIQDLDARGFTYRSDGSTYYRISKFPEYGKLSHNDFSGMRAGGASIALGGWAVGGQPKFFPEGLALRVPKGSDLVVQYHFHPTGKPSATNTGRYVTIWSRQIDGSWKIVVDFGVPSDTAP